MAGWRGMGFLSWPELVKNREIFLPLSAMRAMDSAETEFFFGRIFFIFIELAFCAGNLLSAKGVLLQHARHQPCRRAKRSTPKAHQHLRQIN